MPDAMTHLNTASREPGRNQVWVRWEFDGQNWHGKLTIWDPTGSTQLCEHAVICGDSSPVGGIHLSVDPCAGGAWAFDHLEGVGVTARDLQWAMLYAIAQVERKHAVWPCETGEEGAAS